MSASARVRAARKEVERLTGYGSKNLGMLSPVVLQAELGKKVAKTVGGFVSRKLGALSARTKVVLSHPGAKKVKESMMAVIVSAVHERLTGEKIDPNSIDLKKRLGDKYEVILNKKHGSVKALVKDIVDAMVSDEERKKLGDATIKRAIKEGVEVGFDYLSGVRLGEKGRVLADVNRGVVLDLANNGKVLYEVKPKEGEKYIVSLEGEEKRKLLAVLEEHGIVKKEEDYFDLLVANVAINSLRGASTENEAKEFMAEKLHEHIMTDQLAYNGALKKIEKDKSLFYGHVILSAMFKRLGHMAQGLAIGMARAAAAVLSMVPIVGAVGRGMAEIGETVAMSSQMLDYDTTIWASPEMLPAQEPALVRAAQRVSAQPAQAPAPMAQQAPQASPGAERPATVETGQIRWVGPQLEELQKEVQRQLARKKMEEAMKRQMIRQSET